MTQSNYVTVILTDMDQDLPNDMRMIAKFEDIFVPEGEEATMTILKLAHSGKTKKALEKHNEKRVKIPLKSAKRRGVDTNLEEIEIDEVDIEIR